MKKKAFLFSLLAFTALLSACQKQTTTKPGIIQCRVQPANYSFIQNRLKKPLPSFITGSVIPFRYDVRSCNLTGYSPGELGNSLDYYTFDSKTRWPQRLPDNFNPIIKMNLGMRPGLGIHLLHKQGVTGKGVNMAIIDQKLLTDHREYKNNLVFYEEFGRHANWSSMHGPSVTSLAVGKQCGTAPGARVYYCAVHVINFTDKTRRTRDFTSAAKAVERILEINRRLPAGKKIRVISFSAGWKMEEKGATRLQHAMDRARKSGIFVCSVNSAHMYGYWILGMRRKPMQDPDKISSYERGTFWRNIKTGKKAKGVWSSRMLLAPMDNRTTASPTGVNDYTYWGMAGLSWSIPWVAGVYALAIQVNPDITPEKFMRLTFRTGTKAGFLKSGRIINPVKLIKACRK